MSHSVAECNLCVCVVKRKHTHNRDLPIVLQCYLKRGVDAADQGVQDVDALVSVEEDEGEEGLQQGRLRDASQKEVKIRRGGHHLLQGQLFRDKEPLVNSVSVISSC